MVWAPVWPVFAFFADWLVRCWRYPPLGGPPLGLDWVQAQALAAAAHLPWDGTTCENLRLMEEAALTVWTEKWERRHPSM